MGMAPRLELRQSQSLVMTPQLQQAIRLLALSNLEIESFVAEEIEKFVQTPVMDASGSPHRGVLQASDLDAWSPTWEAPEQTRYQGWTVSKTSFWGQGPVFLQQLQLLDALGLADIEYGSAEYLHVAIEASKLAFADREAWYGDPRFVHVPRELLSAEYAGERAGLAHAVGARPLQPDRDAPGLRWRRSGVGQSRPHSTCVAIDAASAAGGR